MKCFTTDGNVQRYSSLQLVILHGFVQALQYHNSVLPWITRPPIINAHLIIDQDIHVQQFVITHATSIARTYLMDLLRLCNSVVTVNLQ